MLIAIGGREDKGLKIVKEGEPLTEESSFFVSGILKEVTSFLSTRYCRIEVLTTASSSPEKMQKTYQGAFGKLGYTNIGFIHMRTKEDAASSEYIERIRNTEGIFITGGSQAQFMDINEGTDFIKELKKVYCSKKVVIAGTSAGAMVMSALMIDVDADDEENTFDVTPGLSLLKKVIIDTHFSERGRFWRLADAVAQHQDYLGIGMDENTAIVVRNGSDMQVIGFGLVALIEGQNISHYDSPREGAREKLTIENLVTHILSKNDQCNITERKIVKKGPTQKKKG